MGALLHEADALALAEAAVQEVGPGECVLAGVWGKTEGGPVSLATQASYAVESGWSAANDCALSALWDGEDTAGAAILWRDGEVAGVLVVLHASLMLDHPAVKGLPRRVADMMGYSQSVADEPDWAATSADD